jgi:hypothetical protein
MDKNKVVTTIILVSLLVSSSYILIQPFDDNLIFNFKFDKLNFTYISTNNSDFIYVSIEGCDDDSSIGNPILPSYIANFLVPNNKKIDNIKVTYDNLRKDWKRMVRLS